MSVRHMFFGIALATLEPIRELFSPKQPKTIVHVLEGVECPPFFYIRIDERVWALRLLRK